MSTLVLADIHGNLPALEAVLRLEPGHAAARAALEAARGAR